ncbi:MAG TPA: maleylpyruvate isomerase family mycothiol-dependent enzyme [Mycobacteriales bacterium]|nr:maleylpyruvate isomerase family mycothiol-dependent enzyme [Mycobacteriales bacterium]
MTSLPDRTITAIGDHHDALADVIPNLSDDELTAPSGASEWTVAQVFSHLGSGAELGLATFQALVTGDALPDDEANRAVWDRWNAMSPREQADGFLEHNERLLDAYEELTPDQRENLEVKLPYLPEPIRIATYLGMRLNELALHSWDARVALDNTATLDEEAAAVLAEHHAGEMSFLLAFTAKPAALGEQAVLTLDSYGLVLADRAALTTSVEAATATFDGPLEAFIRLISGRLKPEHTPSGVAVTGNVSLDDLRKVFPGY